MTTVLAGATIGAMSLAERLKQVLELREVSASRLSLDAGLSRTALQKIIDRGGARTSADTITRIARAARVNRTWLETGAGHPEAADDDFTGDPPALQAEHSTPVMANVPGYLEVEAQDRVAHPEIEDDWWERGRRASPFLVLGQAQPGDAYSMAVFAKKMGSPERLAALLAERELRIKDLEREVAAQRAREAVALARKKGRRKA
jgi:transcriptional regulator with XRE-family HTH domain